MNVIVFFICDFMILLLFDNALINAGMSNYNLLKVSSILPINCTQEKSISLVEGSPLLVAYGSITSNLLGSTISSAVSIAVPQNNNEIGIIMEFSGYCNKILAEQEVENMAERAMHYHNISIKKIICSSIETIVEHDYHTVFSGVALW